MRNLDGRILLSASDLMRFMGCAHATTLDLAHMRGAGLELHDKTRSFHHGFPMIKKRLYFIFVYFQDIISKSRITRTLATAAVASLVLASTALADVSDLIRGRLVAAGWGAATVDALLEMHTREFEIDARSGWLPQRLELLARLGRHPAALRMVETFPEYADLFVNAAEPNALAQVIGGLSADRTDRERLLNLFIGWPSRSEIGHLHQVLERHGSTLMAFVDSRHLFAVTETLVLAHAEQAPQSWTDWVAAELRRPMRPEQLDETLVAISTHGPAIARLMEAQPGFAAAFPRHWSDFRQLLGETASEEARVEMLTGLLSHEGVWQTLSEPFGTAALARTHADWVPELLLVLWGTKGWVQPVEAAGELLEPRGPMPPERRIWLLTGLAAEESERRSLGEWGLMLSDTDAFWAIALDPARVDLLNCVLTRAKGESSWDGTTESLGRLHSSLDRLADLTPRGLRRYCRADDPLLVRALPGYHSVNVMRDLWEGAPVGPLDVVSTVTEIYFLPRYAALLVRGARVLSPAALRLAPRMSLDHLRTQRAAAASGERYAVALRPMSGRGRAFVLVKGGWLAPIARRHILMREDVFLSRETLENLAAEGIVGSDFTQRVILHFRCAGTFSGEDPQCL